MSEFKKCKKCGYSINGMFNDAKPEKICERGEHDFESFVYCAHCHSHDKHLEYAPNAMFCSHSCNALHKLAKGAKKSKLLNTCISCGNTCKSMRCPACDEKVLSAQRKEQEQEFKVEVDAFSEFKNCKYGVCDIVKAHHNALQNDPQRLSSEFMIGIICGTEGKDFYLERRSERLNKEATV